MAKKVNVSFVLDETGSMGSVKDQTISGFNEYVKTLKESDGADSVRFTLTKFNSTKMEVAHKAVKLDDVAELNEENYQPDMLTPLYDAIGRTVSSMEKEVKGKKQAALVIIQTDGQENASREYTREMIFDLIEKKKEKGWTFVFLGADQDAWLTGQALGLDRGNVIAYASAHTADTFSRAASATNTYVTGGGEQSKSFWDDTDDD